MLFNEISRDIYIYIYVMLVCLGNSIQKICMPKCVAEMRGRNYVAQTHACSKSVLGAVEPSFFFKILDPPLFQKT